MIDINVEAINFKKKLAFHGSIRHHQQMEKKKIRTELLLVAKSIQIVIFSLI